ncbi:MAG: ATP-binding protein [Cellulophaga sp.]
MKLILLHTKIKHTLLIIALFSIFQSANSQKNSNSEQGIESHFRIAKTYENENKMNLALKELEKAQELAEKNLDDKGLINCYNKFSLLYLKLKDEESTLFYYDRANVSLKDIEFPYGLAINKYIEAMILFKDEKIFMSLFLLDEAKRLNNNRNFLNNVLLAKGELFIKLEKFEEAEKNLSSLVVNNDILEKNYLATRALIGLGRLHRKTGKHEESIKLTLRALDLAKKNNFNKEILEANQFLTATYEELELFKSSLEHLKNTKEITDSVFTVDKIKTEAKTANQIKFDSATDTVKKLEKENEELKDAASKSEITAILASIFLTIISLLAVSLYRNNKIKLKTNDLLHTKNKELQTAKDSAVLAMEAKTNFLSTVSHELRTPLYAVTGLTHLLLEEKPREDQMDHLKSLKFSGDYLLNFINDILQINKIDADKLEPINDEFNLKKVLTEVTSALKQNAKQNNTEIILDFDSKIPKNLTGDSLRLSQIFMNLVGNALKFTKDGEVTIIARSIKNIDDDITIYFEVKDTGIGISKENQKNIFDSFEQGSIQINREYGGTGLGLTIVKSLLGIFNSQIQLKSELGKGSSFFFELNLKVNNNVIEDTPFEITQKEYNLKGLHLLIVEDNKINQVITKKMLSKKDVTSDIASNGTDAIEMTINNKYDAILMDIHMPGISGVEATIEIRKFNKEIPIIALTAISLDDSLDHFYAAGCDDVVTKPFKPEIFYQKIGENIFEKKIKKQIS